MGTIAKDNNQITVYYNSESSIGKQARAFIESSEKEVLGIDVSKTKVTATQWLELTDKLGVSMANLVNTAHSDYFDAINQNRNAFEEEDWIKIVQHNPNLLYGTIMVNGQNVYHYINPSDFIGHMENLKSGSGI